MIHRFAQFSLNNVSSFVKSHFVLRPKGLEFCYMNVVSFLLVSVCFKSSFFVVEVLSQRYLNILIFIAWTCLWVQQKCMLPFNILKLCYCKRNFSDCRFSFHFWNHIHIPIFTLFVLIVHPLLANVSRNCFLTTVHLLWISEINVSKKI